MNKIRVRKQGEPAPERPVAPPKDDARAEARTIETVIGGWVEEYKLRKEQERRNALQLRYTGGVL